jgi:transcription elongation factor Elf1
MSSSGIIIALRCMDCSKQVSPSEVVRMGIASLICWDCYIKQREVLEGWSPPKECALCQISFLELAKRELTETVKMYPHWIDGTFGMLCAPCDKIYVLKRRDQFAGTPFGKQRNL